MVCISETVDGLLFGNWLEGHVTGPDAIFLLPGTGNNDINHDKKTVFDFRWF